jgi:outer membrane protein
MHMKKIILSALTLGVVANSYAQEKWDLKECVDYATVNNISIRQQDIQTRLAALTYQQSMLQRFPSINAGTNGGVNFGRSVNPTTNQFENNRILYTGFNLSANVELFNWFSKRYAREANKLEADAAIASLEKAKNDVALNVAVAYIQALLAREQIKTSELQLSQRIALLENTRKRVNAGVLPELNALEIESQVASDSSALVGVKVSAEQALLQLKSILNLDAGAPFDIETPVVDKIPIDNIADLQPEVVFALAVKNFPQQKVNELKYQAALKSIESARRQFFPSVSMNGNMGTNYAGVPKQSFDVPIPGSTPTFSPSGLIVDDGGTIRNVLQPVFPTEKKVFFTPFGQQLDRNFSQAIGISISIPIFNGGANRINYQRSKWAEKTANLSRENDNQRLKQDIYKAYNDAVASLQRYNASKKALELARKAYDFATKRYDLQLLSTIDYLTNQNTFFRAGYDLLYAQYDYVFKMKLLEFYKGQGLRLN